MRRVKYLCVFKSLYGQRAYALSGMDKALYIIKTLNKLNVCADVISASVSKEKSGVFKQKIEKIDDYNRVVSGITFGTKSFLGRLFQKILALIWLFYYLLRNTQKNDFLIVYHSVKYSVILFFVKKIKKVKICLEVEEIFYETNPYGKTSRWRIWLENLAINQADSYIFASQQLANRCKAQNKPFAIANGRYLTEPIMAQPDNDGLIHVLYAGLIRTGKVAFNCLNIADYLSSNYRLHIIGYGEQADIIELEKAIDKKNVKNHCKIVYDGMKRDDEYKIYLQKCHIGLCPLPSKVSLQSACFPSKITSYLANGLRVVTTENEVIRFSAYGKIINFAKSDKAEDFAYSIQQIDFHKEHDSRSIIQQCDSLFQNKMNQIIGNDK